MALVRILLLDIDGVLVEPRGYRASTLATLRWFSRRWGWQFPLPGEEVMASFEAHGITSEWDMVPLMLAWVAEDVVRRYGPQALPPMPQGPEDPRSRPAPRAVWPRAWEALPPQVVACLRPEVEPARAVWETLRTQPEATPFPHLARALAWAEQLLAHTRDVLQAPTTRIFQNYALGTQAFEETYATPAWVFTPSLLLQEDRPLLSPQAAAQLMAGYRQGRWRLVAFTRRPTRPSEAGVGYAPEGELALERAGLPDIPLLGQGHMALWAQARGLNYERVMKPAAVHPLAALLVALGIAWTVAMDAAFAWSQGQPLPLPSDFWPDALQVIALEDAWVGLRAVEQALQAVRQAGVTVHWLPLGVALEPQKQQALQGHAVRVYPNPDQALQDAGILSSTS